MPFLSDAERAALEAALPGWLPQQRWYGAKDRPVGAVHVVAALAVGAGYDPPPGAAFGLAFVHVEGADAPHEDAAHRADLYGLPLARAGVTPIGASGLHDGAAEPDWWRALVAMWADELARHRAALVATGKVASRCATRDRAYALWTMGGVQEITEAYDVWDLSNAQGPPSDVHLVGQDASNASALVRLPVEAFNYRAEGAAYDRPHRRSLDAWVFVKVLRRLPADGSRERDLLGALDPDFNGPLVPALLGELTWGFASEYGSARPRLAALATAGYGDARDAWAAALGLLGARDAAGWTDLAARLGAHVAALHGALRTAGEIRWSGTPSGTRPLARPDVQQLLDATRFAPSEAHRVARRAGDLPPAPGFGALVARVRRLADEQADLGLAIPIHGDLHLGQVLVLPGGALRVVDFEGEPNRPEHERTRADSPLRDVAGMLRSFDYAACNALPETAERETWRAAAETAFLGAYTAAAEANRVGWQRLRDEGQDPGPDLWPDADAFGPLLRLYLVQKAVYEVEYERAYRPGWAWIPEQALARLLADPAFSAGGR